MTEKEREREIGRMFSGSVGLNCAKSDFAFLCSRPKFLAWPFVILTELPLLFQRDWKKIGKRDWGNEMRQLRKS